MNSLGISGFEQIFLGLFLIAHGSIYIIFLFLFYDEKSKAYLGWTGKSWVLSKIIDEKLTKYAGKILWIITIIFFVLSGLSILNVPVIEEYSTPLIVIASIIAILAFIIFFDGLSPTPYHWILGSVINIALLAFVLFFNDNIILIIGILVLITLWGLLFHTKLIKLIIGNSLKSQTVT
ncbi:MAG: hypothetical protein ACFFD1_14840 [Candidatus Thorarchaeota archaeon]